MASREPATGDLFTKVRPRALGVGELTRALKLALEPRFRDVWVAGEVTNCRRQASGHFYFTLKDDEACVGAVMWASQARRLPFELKDGLEVVAHGFVEIYPPHGKYQLVCDAVEPRGAGAQALLLQQIKERLQQDGLLDPARKRPLPRIPRRVGVATSPTGAALRDFLRVLHQRWPDMPVLVAPCRVQGDGAAASVIAAVKDLCSRGVDVVVVTRGGGSQEDLSQFNDERLARAAAACAVPLVSAVGHEVDYSVLDLVADVRAATPTHAAQLVVPDKAELEDALKKRKVRLWRAVQHALAARRQELKALRSALPEPQALLSRERHKLDDLLHRAEGRLRARVRDGRSRVERAGGRLQRAEPRARLRALMRRVEEAARRLNAWPADRMRREERRVERLKSRLEPANVAKLLSRGFSLVLKEGKPVARASDLSPGDAVRVALSEGWADADITATNSGIDPLPGRKPSRG